MSIAPPIAKTMMLIRRPVAEVFRAFVDPSVTTRFWFTRSTGHLSEGAHATWFWDMYGVSANVQVVEFVQNQRLVVNWPTRVEWTFEPRGESATFVTIISSGFTGTDDEQVARAIDSMGGFSFTLAACKAWLEHGIELQIVRDHSPDHYVATWTADA